MKNLTDYMEPGPHNDRLVQMALRDTENADLANAMVEWSEAEQEIILRNMSPDGIALLKEEMAQGSPLSTDQTRAAASAFLSALASHRDTP